MGVILAPREGLEAHLGILGAFRGLLGLFWEPVLHFLSALDHSGTILPSFAVNLEAVGFGLA